jgi:hypothetical protein
MNGISQNGHKGSDRISNGSVNPEKQRFFDSSAHHATGTNDTDTTDGFLALSKVLSPKEGNMSYTDFTSVVSVSLVPVA